MKRSRLDRGVLCILVQVIETQVTDEQRASIELFVT